MRLFKILALLSLFFSQNLFAPGVGSEDDTHEAFTKSPRVLRGVRVDGAQGVSVVSKKIFPREVSRNFGMISYSMDDWSTYLLSEPNGVFWTSEATQIINQSKLFGAVVDFDPNKKGFALPKDILVDSKIKAGSFEINFLDALLQYPINEDGILVITP